MLLKIAGYLRDHGIPYELITDEDADLGRYQAVYLSRVFVFTQIPRFISDYRRAHPRAAANKIHMGGTGFYALEEDRARFVKLRQEDMERLSHDPLLPGRSMM